jgi:hypothetical protein
MSKEKEGKAKSDKSKPVRNLMEKRAAKEARRKAKRNSFQE